MSHCSLDSRAIASHLYVCDASSAHNHVDFELKKWSKTERFLPLFFSYGRQIKLSIARTSFVTRPRYRGADHCDEHVCLSVRTHISETELTTFSVHLASGRGSVLFGGVAVYYVLPVLWMTSRLFHIMDPMAICRHRSCVAAALYTGCRPYIAWY